MQQVLYRKYRPLTFSQVINQDHVKTTLINAVSSGRIGHAYLFTGPRGIGKTTLARIYARAVNCKNRNGSEPCNACDVCKSFLDGSSLDLIEIDAATYTQVENIRGIIDHLQFTPTQASYKVIIIDEVHMLSKSSFNALLKTLEEPPAHAIFILATTEIHKVPATIISRTQRFDLKKVGIADLSKLLKSVCDDLKITITEEALVEISTAADGSFRDGLSLLDQIINYTEGQVTENLVEQVLGMTSIKTTGDFFDLIAEKKSKEAVDFITKLLYEGKDVFQFHKDFLEYLRKVLLNKIGVLNEFGFTQETQNRIKTQAQKFDLNYLLKVIEIFQKAGSDLRNATIQSLPLEIAAVEACGVTQGTGDRVHRVDNKKQETDNNEQGTKTNPSFVIARSVNDEAISPRDHNSGNKEQIIKDMDPKVNSDAQTLDLVKTKWPQILEKVKEYNHSLISSLKIATPDKVVGKDLILIFPYKFHKDTIEARKNKIVVDQVIEDVVGIKLFSKGILQKDINNGTIESESEKEDVLKSAMDIMGGQIE